MEVRQAEAAARERRRRRLTVAAGIVAVWSLLLAVFALWRWRVADVQRRFAEQSYEAAINQFNLAETQRQEAEKALASVRASAAELEQAVLEATQGRQAEATERRRAEAAAQELRATLKDLQTKVDANRRQSAEQLEKIQNRGLPFGKLPAGKR